MSKTDWSTGAEVKAMLAALPSAIAVPDAYDMDASAASAVADINRRTGYVPFFSDGTESAVPFDPPGPNTSGPRRGGSYVLRLRNGLISFTSLFVSVNAASSVVGQEAVAGKDFYFTPADADNKGRPYTEVEFITPQWGMPQSIVLTGVWGYCADEIPDDIWLAHQKLTAAMFLEDMLQGLQSSATLFKSASGSEVEQGAARDLGVALRSSANKTIGDYKLI